MKKILYLLGSFLFLIITAYIIKPLFYQNRFPSVIYTNIENKGLDVSKIYLNNKETHLFYVNPTCNSCDSVAVLLKNIDPKKHNRMIICSYIAGVDYREYKKKFNLLKDDFFLIDKQNSFPYDFNVGFSYSLPIQLKFDKQGKKL